jgi:hypothetical protein
LDDRSSIGEFHRPRFSDDHHRNDRSHSRERGMATSRLLAWFWAGSHPALDTRREEQSPRSGMGLSSRSRYTSLVLQRKLEPTRATGSRLPVGAFRLVAGRSTTSDLRELCDTECWASLAQLSQRVSRRSDGCYIWNGPNSGATGNCWCRRPDASEVPPCTEGKLHLLIVLL